MPRYDGVHFDPPAPVALVSLCCPETRSRIEGVEMLLDSGADVSLVPKTAVEHLGVSPLSDRGCELVSFDGSRSLAKVVVLDMIFAGKTFRGRYLVIDAPWGIIGRDVLNHLSIAMNGPALEWSKVGD